MPVLPAAAGRAPLPRPLPRPLRYWPRVLAGGSRARAGPAGPRRLAASRASRPPSLAVPRCGGRPSPQSQSWTLAGGPCSRWLRRAAVNPEADWGRAEAAPPRPRGAERFWGPPTTAVGARKGLATPGLGEGPSSLGRSLSALGQWAGDLAAPVFPASLHPQFPPAPLSSAVRGGSG